jgi:hypothetical protein
MCSALVWAFLYSLAVSCLEIRSTNADEVLPIIIIRQRTVHKRSWEGCIDCSHNKRELYSVHTRYWEGCIGYNRNVHIRSWEGCIGYNRKKRELYINVPGKYVLTVVIIRENCT